MSEYLLFGRFLAGFCVLALIYTLFYFTVRISVATVMCVFKSQDRYIKAAWRSAWARYLALIITLLIALDVFRH